MRPKLVVEVGSFIGSGAINVWGEFLRGTGTVLCVDPWQGDLVMRLWPRDSNVFYKFGMGSGAFPTLGQTFMRRVVGEGLQSTVFPLPIPSLTGARLLFLLGYRVDVVYLDSAHERGETAAETMLYFQLLRPGGLLMGDDYSGFPAVEHDVSMVAGCLGLRVQLFGESNNQWLIQKPHGWRPTLRGSKTFE